MPICGECLRVEEKVGIREDIPLEQGVKEAIGQPFEMINAFEMIMDKKPTTVAGVDNYGIGKSSMLKGE
jgi:hypothetical protein